MRIKFTVFLSVFFTGIVFGQTDGYLHCGSTEQLQGLKNSDPKLKMSIENSAQDLENFTKDYIANHYNPSDKNTIFTIPVVFHIIHVNGPENISDAQIYDAIDVMNRDYSRLNPDTINVVNPFKPYVADCQIQFKLAQKDPNGNCTNGITRTYSMTTFKDSTTSTGVDMQVSAVQAAHGNWPGNMYLNIFVSREVSGFAGYTYNPFDGYATEMKNGIKVLYDYVGSIGESSPYTSRTLTHEAGHWCNLAHPWGDNNGAGDPSSCDIDDHVADTPLTIGSNLVCNLGANTCDDTNPSTDAEPPYQTLVSSWTYDVIDNVQNYMDYSYCTRMFTLGQKARMQAALSSSTGQRNNVVSASNLLATGVNDPQVFCKADFSSSTFEVCMGGVVDFTDHSYFAPNQWNWTFTGGTPSTSTMQNPSVTYNTPGTYAVTLTSGDGTGSDTKTQAGYITVLPSQGTIPIQEGFETYSTLASSNGKWTVDNPSGNAWEVYSGTGFTGTKCIKLNNISQTSGSVDGIISGDYDLSNLQATDLITLSFRSSFKQSESGNTDKFKVYASSDCGVNWGTRKQILSSALSQGIQSSVWTPSTADDWMTTHVTNITSNYFTSSFRLKFEFTNGGGNNIYLDDINLYAGSDDPLSIKEFDGVVSEFNVYPNPSVGDLNVLVTIPQSMDFNVRVVDLSGKQLQNHLIQGQTGVNNVILDVNSLAKGMYFIEINTSNGAKLTKQFIKQ